MQNLTWLILALPLAGFVTLGLCGRVLPRRLIGLIGCGVVCGAFVAAVVGFISMLGMPATARTVDTPFWPWLTSGGPPLKFGLPSDPLPSLLLLVLRDFADFLSNQYVVFTEAAHIVAPASLRTQLALIPSVPLTAITLLLFVAAAAKSAQLPLHVWLPDAMEGPTPVSALIHAATMVTAGVYLVARCAPLFSAAPFTLGVVGVVTGLTALMAATIACVQTDIKRVLAYSTMSQLGYMFMAESAAAPPAGLLSACADPALLRARLSVTT